MQNYIHVVSGIYEDKKKGLSTEINIFNKLEKAEEKFQEIINKFIIENGEEHIEYDSKLIDYVELHSSQCKLTVENNFKIVQ